MDSNSQTTKQQPTEARPELLPDVAGLLALDDPRWLHESGVIGFTGASVLGKIVYANQAAQRLLGLTKTAHGSVPDWSAPDLMDLQKLFDEQRESEARGPKEAGIALNQIESRCRTRLVSVGGRELAVEFVPVPPGVLKAETIAIVRDVTDTKTTLAKIESVVGQLSGFMRSAPTLSFIKDEQLRYVYVNPAYEAYFGLQHEEILGKTDQDFRPAAVARRLRENDQIVLSLGHPLQSIDQVPGRSGGEGLVPGGEVPVPGRGGAEVRVRVGREHQAQVKAEEEAVRLNTALREQIAENKLLLESLPVGIAVARDPTCAVIEANPMLAAMLGIKPTNNVSLPRSNRGIVGDRDGHGRSFSIVRDGEEVPPEHLPMSVACSTGKAVEKFEATVIRADGNAAEIVGSAAPLLNADGSVRGAVGAFLDVSEQRRLHAALLQSNKMESIGRLAGGVAHDFNNLLTAVMGFADLIENDLSAPSRETSDSREAPGGKSLQHVRGLKLAAEQAAALTRQLLAFARKQPFSASVISIDDLVREQETMIRRLVGERVRVRIELGAGGAMIKADTVQVQQVLMSLAANARDAIAQQGATPGQSAGQGELVLTSTEVSLGEHDAECMGLGKPSRGADAAGGGLTPGRYVRLDVRDTGRGISAENRSRLFEPFFTTKPRGRGTGLGLATAYGIMRQHGGTISVTSEIGAGATFHLFFPQVATRAASSGAVGDGRGGEHTIHASASRGGGGGRETVLLVEDEPLVMDVAERMLSALGYRVIRANDGATALRAAERHIGQIALLLTDVVMPDMNGPELADRLMEMCPKTRVLFMSGYPDEMRGRATPMKKLRGPLLLKPFTIEDLGKHVRSALSGETEQIVAETKL
jgi:two-component system, cell cycle sensor histidine kinase and response regulator CckA